MIPGYFWSRFPILRYCLMFIAGILLYLHLEFPLHFELALLVIASCVLIILAARFAKSFTGLLVLLLILVMGYFSAQIQDVKNDPKHILNLNIQNSKGFNAIVIDGPRETAKTHRYLVELIHEFDSSRTNDISGKAILYVRKDTAATLFEYGDELIIKSRIDRIKGASNLWDFDYSDYMANKGIYHQLFATKNDVLLKAKGLGSPIKAFAIEIREFCISILRNHISSPSVLGISEALLLGLRNDLDRETKSAFVDAGAIHVLAVSGLHVGIIYQILLWSFGFVKRFKGGHLILFTLTVSLLFAYALITGFSPSVTRAVLMFSIVATGNLINRKSNTYNTLSLAALIILIINTNQLYDLGFQLSFAAVFGIVYFYPLLTKHVVINNLIMDKAYKLSCVSIGAQLATLPLTLYYFHQFPTLFLLSNFVVIPLAGIILGSGIALIGLSWIPKLSDLFAWVHEGLIQVMSTGVFWINRIPHSVKKHIYFDETYLILLALLLLMTILIIEYRKKELVYVFSSLMLILALTHFITEKNLSKQSSVLIFSIGERIAFGWNNGSEIFISESEANISRNFSLAAYASYLGNEPKSNQLKTNFYQSELIDFWVWNGKSFANPKRRDIHFSNAPDWLMIDSTNAQWRPDTLYYPLEGFILGRNIPFFKRSEITSNLRKRSIVYHDLKELGSIEIACNGID